MKIIDLLNKIANGEELPKKIKYDGRIYEYVRQWEQYVHETLETPLLKEISAYNYSGLNDEVEILEEEKKIPEKLSTISYTNRNTISIWNEHRDKINEIIDYLDYLKSKGE